jgi:release factor glutamine methyltransferase
LVERRAGGEPLTYILGEREFYARSFVVDRRVLVPRPETEELLAAALDFAAQRRRMGRSLENIVDVGTGSGVLAVSLACELREVHVIAVDCSADALAVADVNRRRHNVAARVSLVQSDLLAAIDLSADLVVANLPYVPTHEIERLQPEVRREPRQALDGGLEGFDEYRRFFPQAADRLGPIGGLYAEIGADQGDRALTLAKKSFPGRDVTVRKDLAGHDRLVVVQPVWPAPNC